MKPPDAPPAPGRMSVESVLVWWRLRQAFRDLQGQSSEKHDAAVQVLIASSPRCWHGLRKIAFREKGTRAVSAAKLLFDLGDTQGIFALLEQYSSVEVRREAEGYLEECLRKVGPQRVEALLNEALQSVERRPLTNETWGLAASVYALRVLVSFRHILPQATLSRAILISQVTFDSLTACRAIFPYTAFTDYRVGQAGPMEDYFVGDSLAALRRSAVDTLLAQEGAAAFALLCKALAHPDVHVQFAAIYGLCRLREERALPLFQRIASNKKHPLAHDAQRAIERFGTKLPDVLTLVRGSQLSTAPDELLRPAGFSEEKSPDTLLRPSAAEPPPLP